MVLGGLLPGTPLVHVIVIVVTGLAGVFDVGVGAMVGSAIVNGLVIPAAAGIVTETMGVTGVICGV